MGRVRAARVTGGEADRNQRGTGSPAGGSLEGRWAGAGLAERGGAAGTGSSPKVFSGAKRNATCRSPDFRRSVHKGSLVRRPRPSRRRGTEVDRRGGRGHRGADRASCRPLGGEGQGRAHPHTGLLSSISRAMLVTAQGRGELQARARERLGRPLTGVRSTCTDCSRGRAGVRLTGRRPGAAAPLYFLSRLTGIKLACDFKL